MFKSKTQVDPSWQLLYLVKLNLGYCNSEFPELKKKKILKPLAVSSQLSFSFHGISSQSFPTHIYGALHTGKDLL